MSKSRKTRTLKKTKTSSKSRPARSRATAREKPEEPVSGEPERPEAAESKAAFPVVGIGASAGGLQPLETFFAAADPLATVAYVVITHQAPGKTSLLPELLGKQSRVPVVPATDGVKVAPRQVYVAPPGCCLEMRDGRLVFAPVNELTRHLPIDHFFRSLARDRGGDAIGIVLSGTGTDGTLGVSEIKGASGMVMAQEPSSARYGAMPMSAIATRLIDFVLPPGDMPAALSRYVQQRPRIAVTEGARADPEATGLLRVLSLLRARTGNDFASYKKSTFRRRIERRMSLHGLHSVADYVRVLEQTPAEVDLLFKELLISVTSFFRDGEAFAALESELRRLIQAKTEGAPLRIWIAGCSTGEEAYSIAILVRELLLETNKSLSVQIFATDLDEQAVEVARIGKYPDGIAADVSPLRLERYFVKEATGYRVSKDVRELIVFAGQNLIKDPPFIRLDLVSCRNLLIYLETDLQKRVLGLFGYALRPGGILFLGTSESLAGLDDVFVSADKRWKIFHRRGTNARRVPELSELPSTLAAGRPPTPRSGTRLALGVAPLAERLLLSQFVPPSVIVSERGELLFVHGRTGPFLEPAPGEPTNNVFQMAREGLRLELPAALRQASASEDPVVRRGLQVKTNGGFTSVSLTVRKLLEPDALRGTFFVTFETEPAPGKKDRKRTRGEQVGQLKRVKTLERELESTRENLQGMIEELETSNEELKSMNEELQSTNEELQSANEELETSREEMQSLNEELQTVNSELEERNGALSQTNDDMQNLLDSTDIATIFLDGKLVIKRFTSQAKKLFSLIDTDIGRPISDLTTNLRYDGLVAEARDVLRTLVFTEREVETKDGSWRLMRIMPYRTHENLIDGLVITFVDIDRVKRAEDESQRARMYTAAVVEAVRTPLLVLDDQLNVVSANRAFYDTFRTTAKFVVGESVYRLDRGSWNIPALHECLEQVLKSDQPVTSLPLVLSLHGNGERKLTISARRLEIQPKKPPLVLLILESAGHDGNTAR